MKLLIIGASGQLGTELCHLLDDKGIDYIGTTSKQLDITDKNKVDNYFKDCKPEIVFDCAAYTNVDGAEENPGKTLNYRVNADGTRNVAEAAERSGAILIYISTDYVFDGTKDGMYTENDVPNPKNEYGRAKLIGEQAVSEIMSKYYIIRTSWVFGTYGNNFVKTMLNLAETRDCISVVNDQIGRPTWTRTLADFMLFAVRNEINYGLYQLCNDGYCSWYEFARKILKGTNVSVIPVTSNEYPQTAFRPRHSVMSISKVRRTGFKIIDFESALKECVE